MSRALSHLSYGATRFRPQVDPEVEELVICQGSRTQIRHLLALNPNHQIKVQPYHIFCVPAPAPMLSRVTWCMRGRSLVPSQGWGHCSAGSSRLRAPASRLPWQYSSPVREARSLAATSSWSGPATASPLLRGGLLLVSVFQKRHELLSPLAYITNTFTGT